MANARSKVKVIGIPSVQLYINCTPNTEHWSFYGLLAWLVDARDTLIYMYVKLSRAQPRGWFGKNVSLNWLTSPCFVYKYKEHIGKSKNMTDISPWILLNFSSSESSRLSPEFSWTPMYHSAEAGVTKIAIIVNKKVTKIIVTNFLAFSIYIIWSHSALPYQHCRIIITDKAPNTCWNYRPSALKCNRSAYMGQISEFARNRTCHNQQWLSHADSQNTITTQNFSKKKKNFDQPRGY